MKRAYATALVSAAALAMSAGVLADEAGSGKSDQPMKDSYITTKVKAELAKDQGTKAREIHVTTKDGVVSLTGLVTSKAEKELAEQDAKRVKGVLDVRNDLTVQ